MKIVTADEALEHVQSGHTLYVHEAAMAPVSLIDALLRRAPDVRNVRILHLHTNVAASYVDAQYAGHLRHQALFVGPNVREAVNDGRADFTPVFLSEIPGLMRPGHALHPDVALVQVSPPDAHGFCRLGTSVACARAGVDHARIVIAEINPQVPRTLGHSAIHESRIHYGVPVDRPLPRSTPDVAGEVERAIGEHVARLVPQGATLQVGIGAVPDAVLAALKHHAGLGVHTEMFSDGMIDLVEQGVVTCEHKTRFVGRIVASFVMGSERVERFVHENPFVELHPSDVVNDVAEIGAQARMTAVNSAIEIDITGQICADSIGERIFSGIGGQMDFVQGAHRSPGGVAVHALPSTAQKGARSRIVARLEPGAGVVTTRGHAQWIVTEQGAVDLRGRSLRERAERLISVAHPDFRPALRAAAAARKIFTP